MAQKFKTNQSQKPAQIQNESAKAHQGNKRFGYSDDSIEEEELLGEPAPDADLEDSTDSEDDECRDDYGSDTETIFSESDAELISGTRPIWLWCAGRIVWSAERYELTWLRGIACAER